MALFDYAGLKVFLDANVGIYGGLDDQSAAETLNALSKTRVKTSLSGAAVFATTDSGEFDALSDAARSEWLSLCSIDNLDPADGTPAVATTVRLFGGASATVIALDTLRTESISPATKQGFPRVRADAVRIARSL